MEWLLFAMTGYFFYALTNIISKTVVTKHIRNIFIYTVIVSFFGLIPLCLIPFYGLTVPELPQLIISLVAGMLWIYALLPFYKALQIEEMSRVVPIWRFVPFFVLIFSFIFIGERLFPYDIAAFALLFLGGILISVKKLKENLTISKAFYWMLLSAFLFGITHTMEKYVFMNQSYLDGFILIRLGGFLAGVSILVLTGQRGDFFNSWRTINTKIKYAILGYGFLQFVGIAFINFAMSLGPVSLVTATGGFQTFFVLILAIILSHKLPHILKEEISKGIISQKIIAILLLILGAGIIIIF